MNLSAFIEDLEDEAISEGPEAVAQLNALRVQFEELAHTLEHSLPGALGGVTPVDGVLDLDGARIYKYVIRLPWRRKTQLPPLVPVTVFDDEGRIIGFAAVHHEGRQVVVNLNIAYSTPERLFLESGTEVMSFHFTPDGRGLVVGR